MLIRIVLSMMEKFIFIKNGGSFVKAKKLKASILSVALVSSLILTSVSGVIASGIVNEAKQGIIENAPEGEKIHESIDISTIRNEGGNPPELLSTASVLASEKNEWYEYIRYSSEPIGVCQIDAVSRVIFHDPYDYGNSLLMEVDDSITDWSSANSLTATYETGNTFNTETSKSTDTVTGLEVAKGADTTTDVSTTTVEGRIDTYNKSKTYNKSQNGGSDETTGGGSTSTTEYGAWSSDTTLGSETQFGIGHGNLSGAVALETVKVEETVHQDFGKDTTTTKIDPSTTKYNSWTEDKGEVTDEGWTEDNTTTTTTSNVSSVIADRMSTSLGQSISETQSWSTSNNHSISKVYEASYFNSSGSPLQWKIVKYSVIMPLMYKVQYLIDGEWITTDNGYCTLTTVQGTCRAWMENNVAHYEHWGTGEPVTWNDFWTGFFTKEDLIKAYSEKLYPEQVRSVKSK